ncbi:hypothetical protein COCVIDRAFT_85797, partial [Bipolaris victoriae FI3]
PPPPLPKPMLRTPDTSVSPGPSKEQGNKGFPHLGACARVCVLRPARRTTGYGRSN